MPDAPTPDMIKRMRVEPSEEASPPNETRNGKASEATAKSRKATVDDEDDEGMEEDEDFAPGNDADYFVEEDEEGRFFGGGLTTEQKEILNIFDSAGGEGAQLDVSTSVRDVSILMQDSFLVYSLGRTVVYYGNPQTVVTVGTRRQQESRPEVQIS
jgi:beta-catenin-like protein 1